MTKKPSYLALGSLELKQRAASLRKSGSPCRWCPRDCGADRLSGETGQCGAASNVLVSGVNLHFGEEAHFVGRGGSGTVFFSCCNLGCLFCQNYDISHLRHGVPLTTSLLADAFISLERQGAENLNLVTPSHYPADILSALAEAVEIGFSLPIVWNSSGYDSVETLNYFDGIVDIYMPDFKFSTDELGAQLTSANNYATVARKAIAEMVRQVGARLDLSDGIAQRGMSVRHLVLPSHYADSKACLDYLRSLSPEITVNVMSQYRPCYQAHKLPGLNRSVDWREYREIIEYGRSIGLTHVLAQA